MKAQPAGADLVFEGFRLEGQGLLRLDRAGKAEPVALGSRALDLLRLLADRSGEVVAKDAIMAAVWPQTVVEESNLTVQIAGLRRILDDGRGQGSCIQTIPRRGYRFTGQVTRVDAGTPNAPGPPLSEPEIAQPVAEMPAADISPPALRYEQEIRFCTTKDGVQLAYSRMGSGPPLVKTGNWMTHLEFDFETPIWRHLYHELSCDQTLIRYDARGNGLSDRDVEEESFETFVTDLEAVVDAAGLERFALFGISQGCAVSVGYAVRHPERVTHLILLGGFVVGRYKRARPDAEKEQDAAVLTLMRFGWGQENPAFRQLFTSRFIPGGTKEQTDWFNELERISISPEQAVRNYLVTGNFDVTRLLAQVSVPTLVMHARDDALVPFDQGRRLAAGIPGARFVPLASRNHLILEDESAFPRFLDEIRGFLVR
jgi:pimeloyl-ACP methyl ester carboxylesterase/DNA-binding winged helix-turn-helix (wHTH) protein